MTHCLNLARHLQTIRLVLRAASSTKLSKTGRAWPIMLSLIRTNAILRCLEQPYLAQRCARVRRQIMQPKVSQYHRQLWLCTQPSSDPRSQTSLQRRYSRPSRSSRQSKPSLTLNPTWERPHLQQLKCLWMMTCMATVVASSYQPQPNKKTMVKLGRQALICNMTFLLRSSLSKSQEKCEKSLQSTQRNTSSS